MENLDIKNLYKKFTENLLSYLFLLKKEFHEVNKFINSLNNYEPHKLDVSETTPQQSALNIAVVISYARNFKRNLGFYNAFEINKILIQDFTDEEIKLHKQMIKWRDTEFAHSDADSNDILIDMDENFSYSLRRIRQPLEKNELDFLSSMVHKIQAQVEKQIKCLKCVIKST